MNGKKQARLVLGASAALTVGAARAAAAVFEAAEETQQGAKVIVLRGKDLEARIAPEAGANLFSLKVGGEELLVQPEKMEDLKLHRSGTPILFPMPNRVRDAVLNLEGQQFKFEANNAKNFIHGLVRQRPWKSEPPVAGKAGASAKVWIDWDEAQPDFARFPLPHRLTVTYTLTRTGVQLAYAVENRGKARLPFGFGVHPWFRVPGERKQVFLQVPVSQRMEAEDKLPTGKLVKVDGGYDLRKPTSLEALDLDDVYFGTTPAAAPSFEWRERGVKVTLAGSAEFTHFVVYTPPGKPFFCMENQTSSTDAHNLHARGIKREAHLLFVEAGKTARGTLTWKVSKK